ncbi:MAG: bifunctional phosphopantothenoylcysteine decarboxylase/phosphopantothenate--cysteine ligase CoaBC [Polyangiaceae bacterium]
MSHSVALIVTGSIAAFKAPVVARLLGKAGVTVVPVLTRAAREFVGATTFAGLTGERAHTDMFDPSVAGELHVELAARCSLVVVAPATADFLARLASGRADDLAAALCLSARGPVLAAPAMHPRMWSHPATQRNVATLGRDGRVELVGPVEGEVASGESGVGRMAEPEVIVAAVLRALEESERRDLANRHIVVSAGPSVEDIDPVRFVGNRSTGKMGFAVAARAAARGARVTLVSGPVELATPPGVDRVDTRGALAMDAALRTAMGPDLAGADALVMTAAVGDYRPKVSSSVKIKRSHEPLTLELIPNPDVLAGLGADRKTKRPVLVGFAVETPEDDEALVREARRKLEAKRVDMVVANRASDSFGRDDNRAILVERATAEPTGWLSKSALADRILDRVLTLLKDADVSG